MDGPHHLEVSRSPGEAGSDVRRPQKRTHHRMRVAGGCGIDPVRQRRPVGLEVATASQVRDGTCSGPGGMSVARIGAPAATATCSAGPSAGGATDEARTDGSALAADADADACTDGAALRDGTVSLARSRVSAGDTPRGRLRAGRWERLSGDVAVVGAAVLGRGAISTGTSSSTLRTGSGERASRARRAFVPPQESDGTAGGSAPAEPASQSRESVRGSGTRRGTYRGYATASELRCVPRALAPGASRAADPLAMEVEGRVWLSECERDCPTAL